MLTIISGNNRDGYPCALNKVDDIFQCGIPPFQTEESIVMGEASQEKRFLLGRLQMELPRIIHFVKKCVFGVKRKITVPTVPKDIFILTIIKLSWYSYKNICTRTVPNCTTYTQGKASSELAEAVNRKSKGDSRSQNLLFLAGLRGQMLGSVKVTATGSAEVTVSMTSEDSVGYGPMHGGLRTDNNLNKKANYGFVQTEDKEKGPAVNPALLSTSMISCTGESKELHHNSYLQASGNLPYSRHQHLNKTGAGFGIPSSKADISRYKRFFCVRNQRCAPIMVGRSGGASALAGFFATGIPTPLRLATPFGIGERGSKELSKEATAMVATTQTRPEFIDTYWIIPEYETTPYGKVSFTRQDRRTFISLFKDSRLIWAGRKPVKEVAHA